MGSASEMGVGDMVVPSEVLSAPESPGTLAINYVSFMLSIETHKILKLECVG